MLFFCLIIWRRLVFRNVGTYFSHLLNVSTISVELKKTDVKSDIF